MKAFDKHRKHFYNEKAKRDTKACQNKEKKDGTMKFFNNLERKFGRFAIPNLMYYIVIMYIAGFIIRVLNPRFYLEYLCLAPSAVIHEFQIWRVVTFLLWPPVDSGNTVSLLIFNFFMVYLYYSLGTTLERIWGTFRFNLYFLIGVLGTILASFLLYFLTGSDYLLSTQYLNASLFMAFAVTFPDMQFYLYGILPVKAKWLGIFDGAIFLLNFIIGSWATKLEIIVSMANFLLFFAMTRNYKQMNPKTIRSRQVAKTKMKSASSSKVHHKCAVCGRTEQDGEELEFRYCSKCEGSLEYCQEHLYTHKHVTKTELDGLETKTPKEL